MNDAQLQRLVDRILMLGRATKGAQIFVRIANTQRGYTRFAASEITAAATIETVSLAVTIALDGRVATATTNQLDDRALDDAVGRALRMARLSPPNPELMAPLARQIYPVVKAAVDPATSAMTAVARTKAVAAAIRAADDAKVTIAGFYDHATSYVAIANSAGLYARHDSTACSFSTTARTPDGTGSGWAGAASNKVADLDPAALATVAVAKAQSSAKARHLDAGKYTVVLEPAAVGALLEFLTGAFDARRTDEGRSYFAKPGGSKVGDKLFPDTITLRTDPTDGALVTAPFDAEGLPRKPTTWLDQGTPRHLAYSRYWAQHQGQPATGDPAGWILDGGKASLDDLVKGVKRGVLITRFWYLRSLDPQTLMVTGLTRDGTYLIENGAVAGPVNNFRFNESPVQMLARCDGLGVPKLVGDADDPRMRVPALRTHEFNLASVSEAV